MTARGIEYLALVGVLAGFLVGGLIIERDHVGEAIREVGDRIEATRNGGLTPAPVRCVSQALQDSGACR